MATMKENITNALSWFYDKLKKNNLDPMEEKIDELNSDLTQVNTDLNSKSNALSTQSFNVDNITVDANSYLLQTIDVSRNGYTALGIIGFRFANASSDGVGTSWVCPYNCYLSSSTVATFGLRNTNSSSSAKIRIYVYVLYRQN